MAVVVSDKGADARVRRRFALALLLSFLILVGGMVWTVQVGRQAIKLGSRVHLAREHDQVVQPSDTKEVAP